MSRVILPVLLLFTLVAAACSRPTEPPVTMRYELTGQILAIHTATMELTVKHEDIPGLMPAMTMTFPVVNESEMTELVPGDLITATLEVTASVGRLVDVVKTGTAELPANTNEVALAGGVLAEGDTVPDAALIDQTDRRRSLAEWRGSPVLFGFVYTTCPLPNYCPLIDRHFLTLQKAIQSDTRLNGRVKLVSISIDPAHDTPEVLAAHAKGLGADADIWTFLTGDLATVDRVAGRYGVGISRPDAPGEIAHNLRTTLVGSDGRVRRIYTGNEWTPDEVLADLRAAVAAE
jgi:protein SCO1/2